MTDTDQVLKLAAIIREVDGNNRKGAAALAESILDHPSFRAALADEPAVPEGREPASVALQPSDEELLSLDQLRKTWNAQADAANNWDALGHDEIVLWAQRQALVRWGNPAPQPPTEGEVEEYTAELEEQKPRPDYHRVQKIATEAQIRSAAQYLAKKQHCDGDLIPAIKYAIARWGNPAPQPVPVSERLPVGVEQALIKAECALSDIAEGEPEENEGDADALLQWAEQRAATALSRIRPVMRLHGILTSEWPPLPAHALPIPHQQENAND